jgi:hypothetical protein
MTVFKPGVGREPAMANVTIQREGKANDPMPVIVPAPNVSAKPIERQFFTYTAEILNRGQKDIKKLAWDYVFSDPVTHEKLKRQLGLSAGPGAGHKKTLQIRTASSPPKVINANAAGSKSAFEEQIAIQCILFADGSLWVSPEAKHESCGELFRKLRPLRNGVRVK